MKLSLLIFLLFFNTLSILGQEIKRNNNWTVGASPAVNINFSSNGFLIIDTFFNAYNQLPQPKLAFGGSNISDTNGNLMLMCNGYVIFNKLGYAIKNWEDINCPNGTLLRQDGSWDIWTQMSTILPKSGNQYYVFTSGMSDKAFTSWKWGTTQDALYFDHLCYHVVDTDANNGEGEVISKNNMLLQDAFLSHDRMVCVQHGNGKDWWLVKPHKKLHKFLCILGICRQYSVS
jgi:hypothetical protein